jgi:hypothetical protein
MLRASAGVAGLLTLPDLSAAAQAATHLSAPAGGDAPINPGDVVAWHDRTLVEHQQPVDAYAGQGYRTISLSIYGERFDPRYAAVMVKRPVLVAQRQFTASSVGQWQQTFDDQAGQGWGPAIVSATGPADNPLIAAVFRQLPQIPLTRHNLTADQLRQWNQQALTQGLIPQWVDAYGDPASTRFVAIWSSDTDRVAWNFDRLRRTRPSPRRDSTP